MKTRLALTIAYDGTDFAGSQAQAGRRTVQGELASALAALYGTAPETVFAGRTDRGVHAAAMVVGVADPRPELPPPTVAAALNRRLPADLAVTALTPVDDGFHARFDARWREYRYRIWNGPRDPLAARQVWQRSAPLDLEAMQSAAALLLGEHDFASFAGGGEGVPWSERHARPSGTVRTLFASAVREIEPWWRPSEVGRGRLLEYRVAATAFLPQMVRAIVAAVVEVGRGARPPSWLIEVLAARDRRQGPAVAPAAGLTLWQVGYGPFPSLGSYGSLEPAETGEGIAAAARDEPTGRRAGGTANVDPEGA